MKVKLKELGTISTGNTPSKNVSEFYDSEDIGFVKPDIISDSQIDYIVKTTEYLSEAARTKARIVKKDAVFVTCIGSIGKVGIAKGDAFAFNQQINAIEPNEKIFPKYLAYSILANKKKLQAIANAPVVPIINKTQFGEFEIDITENVNEQARIVELLDKVCAIITDRKIELEKLDELIKARFVELFGDPDVNPMQWKQEDLSVHLDVIGGYAFKSDQFEEEGIPVLRIGNINSGRFMPVNMVYWKNDDALERYKMFPGDLVVSLTGTVGKDDYGNVCILGDDYPEYYLNQRNAKLSLKETIDKYYLSELLKFERIKKRLTGISRGVRQANISNRDILGLNVPIPPIELQYQFAGFVQQVDKSKVVVQKALDEAQLLFDSLMQKYFG